MSIPLITTNRINDPGRGGFARDADMVSMARPFLADAEFISKAQTIAPIRSTPIGCNQACLDRIFVGKVSPPVLVNPRARVMKP